MYPINKEKSVVLTILNHNVYHLDHVIVSSVATSPYRKAVFKLKTIGTHM